MDDLSRKEIVDLQITGSIYDAKGYTGSNGYSKEKRKSVEARYSDPLQHEQGKLRQWLIDEIEGRGLIIAGMLTISPWHKKADLDHCYRISKCICDSIKLRFFRRHIAPFSLTFFEKNNDDPFYHLHILFFHLPTNADCLGKATLTKGVAQAVRNAIDLDFVPTGYFDRHKLHCDLYDFAIRNPFNANGNKAHLFKDHRFVPTHQEAGMRWSVVGDYQLDAVGKPRDQFDGFQDARGLVAYCTKRIFSQDQLVEHCDSLSLNALLNSPRCPTPAVNLVEMFGK